MNHATIAGHLGQDPEVRFTSSGKKVTVLRVAARVRRTANKDETIWWRVSLWGEEHDKLLTYFKKGSAIIVVGEVNKPEIFTDREGKPQVSMSMTGFSIMFSPFGGGKSEGSTHEPHGPSAHTPESNYGMNEPMSYGQNKVGASAAPASPFSEDEIPF